MKRECDECLTYSCLGGHLYGNMIQPHKYSHVLYGQLARNLPAQVRNDSDSGEQPHANSSHHTNPDVFAVLKGLPLLVCSTCMYYSMEINSSKATSSATSPNRVCTQQGPIKDSLLAPYQCLSVTSASTWLENHDSSETPGLPVWAMNTVMTKNVRPTRNGSAIHPRLKLFLRRSTSVRTPRNNMDVAMKARMGDTNQDRMIGTIPCMLPNDHSAVRQQVHSKNNFIFCHLRIVIDPKTRSKPIDACIPEVTVSMLWQTICARKQLGTGYHHMVWKKVV